MSGKRVSGLEEREDNFYKEKMPAERQLKELLKALERFTILWFEFSWTGTRRYFNLLTLSKRVTDFYN